MLTKEQIQSRKELQIRIERVIFNLCELRVEKFFHVSNSGHITESIKWGDLSKED